MRYQFISDQIDNTLTENQIGILFMREDHKIQFPKDIQIFFIAPPALDDLKKWLDKTMSEQQMPTQDTQPDENPEEPIIMG